jgi:TRAP transporter TAXI family solute receptor
MLWAVALVLSLGSLGLSIWIFGSPPPKAIAFGTGDAGGGFDVLGDEYKRRLEKMGLSVHLVATHGSVDNLRRLARGELDVAFMQAGVSEALEDGQRPYGLAALASHPLWIFAPAPVEIASLRELRGRTVTVGPKGSGTEVVTRALLRGYGIGAENTTLLNAARAEVRGALTSGKAECSFLVCACDAPVIRELGAEPRVHLVPLSVHQGALAQRFRHLRPMMLPRGLLDLERDVPAQDTPVLVPSIMLAAREEVHPRVVEQLLMVAQAVHGGGDQLDPAGRYPTLVGMDLPAHPAAEKYMRSGESLIARVLPYWGVRLVWQAQLLFLPALALLLPFWKTLPLLYTHRINTILKRYYTSLGDMERRIDKCTDPLELRKLLDALDGLRSELEGLARKLPAHLQREVYHWRLHVALVRSEGRDRLHRLDQEQAGGGPTA